MSRPSTSHSPTASTPSTPSRSSSFFAFRSRPSTAGSSTPNKLQRASTSHHQPQLQPRPPSQRTASQTQPQNMPPLPSPQQQQQPASPQPQTQPQPQQSHDQSSPTQDAPLHPEIRSTVSLTMAHTQKIYYSGPLVHKLDRNPDGHRPHKDEDWHDVWAQLYGTTLSIWDMGEVKIANQQGKEVPPSYVNITEAFVHVLGALTQPATATSPARKYTNVITLNTAGTNLLLFSCPSPQDLISWAAAFRLSCWEKSRLEEIYTAHLIRITLNDGRNTPSTLIHGRIEGWVRVRIAGQTGWKKLWMCVSAGSITNAARSSTDVASIISKTSPASAQTARHSSYVSPRRNRISGLFSREKPSDLPERPNISLYAAPRGKDKKKPLLTFDTVTQAFAVYPERPKLITSSTLIKLEGSYGDEDMCANMKHREGWMLLMPDLEGARSVSGEMLKWLIAIHDAFELYGRSKMYSWDPRDSVSMMFAYPIGPEKQGLFLDREVAEALDPREERTPIVRSKLLNIMVERMRGGTSPKTDQNGASPPLPPTPTSGLSLGSSSSIPRLGVLSFEQVRQQQQQQQRGDDWAQPPPHPGDRRALTPITERSTRDSWDTGGHPPTLQRPGHSATNGLLPQSDQIQKQQSEASQDLPKLQTDAESSTFLGEPTVTSPTSHLALNEFYTGLTDSVGSLGSKPDSHRSRQESPPPPRPDSKFDTHPSTDAVRLVGPISSPGKESVFSALPSPYSNQPIHPSQSTFSDIRTATLRSPGRSVTPPIRKGPGVEPVSGSPGSPSRFQVATQRRDVISPPNTVTPAAKAKTLEPTPVPQTDPRPNSPIFSPTPTTVNSPPTSSHTATTTSITSKSEHSEYSVGVGPSPPRQVQGTFSLAKHSNQGHSQFNSYSAAQSQRTVQESTQKGTLSTSSSGKLEGMKPITRVGGGKKGSGDDRDLIEEAGALYYVQEIQGASAVPPPRIVGLGQNIPSDSRGRLDSDDEDEEPSTEDEPRHLPQQTKVQRQPQQRPPPESSPLQTRRPSAQEKESLVPSPPLPPLPASPPRQHPTQSSPSRNQHRQAQGRGQQPMLAPQPQQAVMSTANPIKTMEGNVRSPNPSHPGTETNPTSPAVDSRRTPTIGHGGSGGQGGGSRPGLVSRPSGARDLVKQRGGTGDSISSSRHNGQPQPRHPLPPHPETFSEQPSQFSDSTHTQPPHHQGQFFAQTLGDTRQRSPRARGTAERHPTNMASVNQPQHYDDNSDAFAALTFLERDEANASRKSPPPPQQRRGPTSGTEANTRNTPPVHVTPSDSRDDVSQDSGSYEGKYKSSFAPSKQATQRLAKSQAQQAAHLAAVHRPGKSGGTNGKDKRKMRQDGWAESSDEEEEEEEEEDDEDVDSDGDPVPPRRSQGSGAGPGQNFGKLSAQGSPYGSTTDLHQLGQGKPQRHLPRPPSPGRGYGDQDDHYHQQGPGGPGPSTLRQTSGHYPDPTRSQYFDDRRPSPQPHGHNHLRPQSDFPTPGAARNTVWSQALENKDVPKDNGPQRETFVQIEPSHTMTKAFALHGLLSAGLQDRQERSAKRQEEVAKETGASLVNVPTKPPPPQTGLLGAVSAHERERKREGGIGAALTERERDRRVAEERQRKLDDLTKQQLEMVQNGSMYGAQFGPGFNPMMANPMMMGMNPMMGGWGFNPMMGNPQMFAAQQAAAQAYQQTMMTFAQSQAGDGFGGMGGMGSGMGGMGSPGMLSPMATGQQGLNPMMTGQFDPRMSMMGMPMMGMMGMGMGPMNPMMTGQTGVGPGMGGMGGGTGTGLGTGGGLAMQMTGGSSFDPRLSPQLDLGGSGNPSPSQGSPSGPRPLDAPPPPSRSPANASPAPK